jgi:CRISPR-associated endonuclease/helicase Cas3
MGQRGGNRVTILAKSDGTSLRDHTRHVVSALEAIARPLLPLITHQEYGVAIHGAVLHDLGKAHPYFQDSLRPGFDRAKYQFDVPHRHEISSLLFLPAFERWEWSQIIDMVVAHHKSVRMMTGERGKGLTDLVDDYGEDAVFARHYDRWDEWSPVAFEILNEYGISVKALDAQEMRAGFDESVRVAELERNGRNRWRGLLMSADHLASALQEETEKRVHRLFQPPTLQAFEDRAIAASAELYPLAKKSAGSCKPHTLVIAPTGSGKTDFLLRRCRRGRVFYLLPFQASINAMFLRLDHMLNGRGPDRLAPEKQNDIRRIHASSLIEIDDGVQEETLLQRHPGAALKIMTPHQMAALIFGLAGHEAVALDVAGQDVILDEVHVYSEQAQAMVLALIRSLIRLDCRVHVGSATIPSALSHEIRRCLGGDETVEEVRLDNAALATYDRHVIRKLSDEEAARDYVLSAVRDGKRILFVSNRVADAQDRYRWVREVLPQVPALLVHSRFRRSDRAQLEGQVEAFEMSTGPCIVCSTQVIEVSLDISFDTMVTDCAPLDSLVQRFGRVNRRRRAAVDHTLAEIAVVAPPADKSRAKPYDLDALVRSWTMLSDGCPMREVNLQDLIDAVYPALDMTEIDVHLVDTESGFELLELCNYPRSLLLEALDIDSAAVIRASDLDDYRTARGEARQRFEIPVSVKALRPRLGVWPQETVGNRPFVCPDYAYNSDLGLSIGSGGEPTCIIL